MIARDNKLVKLAVKLKQRKYRESEGLFIAEGVRFIEEAVNSSMVEYILYSKKIYDTAGWEKILNSGFDTHEVSDEIIREICDTENPQGAAAVVKKPLWNIHDIKNGFAVILDRIQDPGNLGTIIRTCDAAEVGGIAVIKGSVDPFNSKVLRATMGSIFHIPVVFFDNLNDSVKTFKNMDYNIYATSLGADKFIYECDFTGKTGIVIGNEARGIESSDLEIMDVLIKIPMPGKAESLNAACASSVVIYEVVRQRLTIGNSML